MMMTKAVSTLLALALVVALAGCGAHAQASVRVGIGMEAEVSAMQWGCYAHGQFQSPHACAGDHERFLTTAHTIGPYNDVPLFAVTHDMGVQTATLELISGPVESTRAAQTEAVNAALDALNAIEATAGTAWGAHPANNKAAYANTCGMGHPPSKVLTLNEVRIAYNALIGARVGAGYANYVLVNAANVHAASAVLMVCAHAHRAHSAGVQGNFGLKLSAFGQGELLQPKDGWAPPPVLPAALTQVRAFPLLWPAGMPAQLGQANHWNDFGYWAYQRITGNIAALLAPNAPHLTVAAQADDEVRGFYTNFAMHYTLKWVGSQLHPQGMQGGPGVAVAIKNIWGILPKAGLEHLIRAIGDQANRVSVYKWFKHTSNAQMTTWLCDTVGDVVFPNANLPWQVAAPDAGNYNRVQLRAACRTGVALVAPTPKNIFQLRVNDFQGEAERDGLLQRKFNGGHSRRIGSMYLNNGRRNAMPATTTAPKPLPVFMVGPPAGPQSSALVCETRHRGVISRIWTLNHHAGVWTADMDALRGGVNVVRQMNGEAMQ